MKITKRQLRRIIKESLKEGHGGYREYGEDEAEYTSRTGTLGESQPMKVSPEEIHQWVSDIAHEPVFRNADAAEVAGAALDQLGDLSDEAYNIAWQRAIDMGFPA